MSKLGFFLSELRRRKVLSVAAAYLFVAWGVIEVSSTVIQMASAPPWIGKVILAVVAVGFPIAIVIAWFFDLSASGLVRTAALDADQRARVLGAKFSLSHLIVALGVLMTAAVAMGFAVWLRPGSTREATFTQLTNFADAATAPALSPDGKMLAFLKGGHGFFGNSATPGQLFVKQLPDGAEVQLTNTPMGKATPAFSPDGSRVYFTSAESGFDWNTYMVSVNGGNAAKVLPNASGLSFLDERLVLFAEIKKGTHMGIRRATIAREEMGDVYWPARNGMAHRAAASPDRKWALIVEMDGGGWLPCRLVPLDGSSAGHAVGPLSGQCSYAAWSPDGRWMYFSSNAGGAFHLWRQRFPKGEPEQLTNGPTEEEGIAVAPDGRSLITSAGVRYNAIWLLDKAGERQLSVESYGFYPIASHDGKRVYFLSRTSNTSRAYAVGNLVAVTLESGTRQDLLAGHKMLHFDISADDRKVVFVSADQSADRQGVWIAPLDLSAAPRRIFAGDAIRVFFDASDNVYFSVQTSAERFLHRLRAPNYSANERVIPEAVRFVHAISPNGDWIASIIDRAEDVGSRLMAVSTRGLPHRMICFCGGGAGPARMLASPISWTRDGSAVLISAQFITSGGMRGPTFTVQVPVHKGTQLPDLPEAGVASVEDFLKLPGARRIDKQNILPGATPDQLFFYEATTIRNLYRVRLPD